MSGYNKASRVRAMPGKQLTHFLCLPLVNKQSRPQLEASLQHFAATAADKYDIPTKAIRPIGTIHLTLGVMNLPTEEQVRAASTYLLSLDVQEMLRTAAPTLSSFPPSAKTIPNDGAMNVSPTAPTANQATTEPDPGTRAQEIQKASEPLIVGLTGLQSMHSPSKTSILYSSPNDPSSRLRSFCEKICSQFMAQGFLLPDKRPLLLHATIVNTIYSKGSRKHATAAAQRQNKRDIRKLDATALIGEFEGYEWAMDIRMEKICICQMGAKKGMVNGVVVSEEYVEIASVPLP